MILLICCPIVCMQTHIFSILYMHTYMYLCVPVCLYTKQIQNFFSFIIDRHLNRYNFYALVCYVLAIQNDTTVLLLCLCCIGLKCQPIFQGTIFDHFCGNDEQIMQCAETFMRLTCIMTHTCIHVCVCD